MERIPLGWQADIERVQHRAHRGHGEVGFKVRRVVPAIGRNRLAARSAKRCQRACQPARPRRRFGKPARVSVWPSKETTRLAPNNRSPRAKIICVDSA
jgi:hypothetical protein